jgi:hypothetical protein
VAGHRTGLLPAEKDRPRQGPFGRGRVQRWADTHPTQALLFAGAFGVLGLALGCLALLEPGGPDYFWAAFYFILIAGRSAWTLWRQYERTKNW